MKYKVEIDYDYAQFNFSGIKKGNKIKKNI